MKRIILLLLLLAISCMAVAIRVSGSAVSDTLTINTMHPPLNVIAIDYGGFQELNWDAPTQGYPMQYYIYRSDTPYLLETFILVGNSSGTSWGDDHWFSGEGGYYVTALHSLGVSRRSNISYIGRLQPVPAILSINASESAAMLSWERLREAEGYLVYYSDEPYATFPSSWQGPLAISENSFIDPLSQKRFYRVLARIPGRTRSSIGNPAPQKSTNP